MATIIGVAVILAIALLVAFWATYIINNTLDKMKRNEEKAELWRTRWRAIFVTTDLRMAVSNEKEDQK